MEFPTGFVAETQKLTSEFIGNNAAASLEKLAAAGYEVHLGLTPPLADQIARMALEPAIKEFCPNDSGSRFTDRDSAASWLSKGRAAYLLIKNDGAGNLVLAGYGWAGAGTSRHVPAGETTFAIRIGEIAQGQGLAEPFAQVIVQGTAAIFGASNFWLETWQSNGGAVHVYHKIGFKDIAQSDDERLNSAGEKIRDTRLYMSLSNELLTTKNE